MLLQPVGELLGLVVALEEARRKGQVMCLHGQAHLYRQAHLYGQAGALGRGGLCSALRAAPVGNAEG